MPVERLGGDADRAIASVLEQQVPFGFELIVVSAEAVPSQTGVRNVIEPKSKPRNRKNRGVSGRGGKIPGLQRRGRARRAGLAAKGGGDLRRARRRARGGRPRSSARRLPAGRTDERNAAGHAA